MREKKLPEIVTYQLKIFEKLTDMIYKIILNPESHNHLEYQAGQYIEILQADGCSHPYSITNAPLNVDHSIELHIRHLPHHQETEKLIEEIKTKKQIHLKGPFGNCILRNNPAYPIVLLAGGTGFAPFKALIEQALVEELKQPIYLYWGARTFQDLYLHDFLLHLAHSVPNFHYIPVLSEKSATEVWNGREGLIHDAVLEDFTDLSRFHIYASGPIEMVYAALHSFQERGMSRDLMYSDMFDYVLIVNRP